MVLMKCRASKLIKAQKKIQKAQSDRRWLSKEERDELDLKMKDDPDVKDLIAYNNQRRANQLKDLEALKRDTREE